MMAKYIKENVPGSMHTQRLIAGHINIYDQKAMAFASRGCLLKRFRNKTFSKSDHICTNLFRGGMIAYNVIQKD